MAITCSWGKYGGKALQAQIREQLESAQLELFEQYRTNPFIQGALDGGKSLEECLQELDSELGSGIKRFLFPRRKDPAYNTKVEQLSELVPAQYLRRRGLFALDNFVVSFPFGWGFIYGLCELTKVLLQAQAPPQNEAWLPIISGGLGLLFGVLTPSIRRRGKSRAFGAAKYIDHLIYELYKEHQK